MFELTISKQQLLTPLLMVAGAVDKKHSLAILSNILLKLSKNQLSLTATDLEIEITASVTCTASQETGAVTIPAKKMIDIIRSLEDDANPTFICKEGILSIKAGRSQFKLATLPADNYPIIEDELSDVEFTVDTAALTHLLQSTYFAMAQQDVRIYLNGLFLEIDSQSITAVTADGHRMAICRLPSQLSNQHHRLLIPKKGVQEMLRLLSNVTDTQVVLSASKNHFKLVSNQYIFSSKLIEARFPPYTRAIPKDQDKSVLVDRDMLKRALSRIVIMANEKLRAVLLQIQPSTLTIIANNQEHEEGIESLVAETEGEELSIGLNATYLLDVLNHVKEGPLRLSFSDTDSSILVQSPQDEHYQYIIMPMKI
ncbi:MAG: DNA polymerase III subunit beta [Legionellaceae bacterium]|nr:DNA polymerase III subunit beta [Legionellaceae bacterium]